MTTYTCPVCGFTGLDEPPENHYICPCCGTQFGYHDVGHSPRELRNMWLRRGGRWFDVEDSLAFNNDPRWSAWRQLDAAGLPYDVPNPVKEPQNFDVVLPGAVIETVQVSSKAPNIHRA